MGIVLLLNTTDQQKTFAIPAALACFIYAAVAWLTCMVMAEGITLFIDIADDVRSIAAKLNQ